MKKIIYGCLIALLSISFGCEKDEINTMEQDVENTSNLNVKKTKGEATTDVKRQLQQQQTYLILNSAPLGTETIDIYLNMSMLEDDYNNNQSNLGYIGPFNVFYRSSWENEFTIYSIEFSNKSCSDNIEKWTVNKDEYLGFSSTPSTMTAGSNTTTCGTKKPVPLEEDEGEGAVRLNGYPNCFN